MPSRLLKKGEYTKTPVQTQYGWHVIQLQDTRDRAPPRFERREGTAQAQIVLRKKFKAYSDEMLKTAKIEPPLSTDPRPRRPQLPALPAPAEPAPAAAAAGAARLTSLSGRRRLTQAGGLFRFQDLLERGLVEDPHAQRLGLGELRAGIRAHHQEAGLLRDAARHLGAELAQRVFGRLALQARQRAGDHEGEARERQRRARCTS